MVGFLRCVSMDWLFFGWLTEKRGRPQQVLGIPQTQLQIMFPPHAPEMGRVGKQYCFISGGDNAAKSG